MNDVERKRRELIKDLFPSGIPRLWCPLLTHYTGDGRIDFDRMNIHMSHLVPWVKGFLIPGSTGDGWELSEEETLKVAGFAIEQTRRHGVSLLLGVLTADVTTMKQRIAQMISNMKTSSRAADDADKLLRNNRVCGFTVCPPRGSSLTESEIESSLSEILEMGMPAALYQLPQVTQNELAPKTFERLAKRYSNLVFFKDSSGGDSIATSNVEKDGVFLVRGAEGNYAKWLVDAGGCYDGFLLSTANCFSRQLSSLITCIEKKDVITAEALSETLTSVVGEVFALVQPLPYGNPFTNANKAIDHFFAFGSKAATTDGPMLHENVRIPRDIIQTTGGILAYYDLMPEKGYLE
ncbi:MAG TPA: dihydrodipicolinate synthase family protein [Syntrophales bacterium]|nr:dihydrodipicolinate synthase family protein [Syntrophales bacterium]